MMSIGLNAGDFLTYWLEKIGGILKAKADRIKSVPELVDAMRAELDLIKEFLYTRAELEEEDESDLEGVGKSRRLRDIMFRMEDVLDAWDLQQHKPGLLLHQQSEMLCSRLHYKVCRGVDELKQATVSCKPKHTTASRIIRGRKEIEKVVGECSHSATSKGRIRYYESIFTKQETVLDDKLRTYHFGDPAVRPLHKDENELVGIEERRHRLISMLDLGNKQMDNKGPSLVVVWGEPGVGKTTLVHTLFQHPHISRHFPLRVWITATKHYNRVHLLKSLLKQFLLQQNRSLFKKFIREEQEEEAANSVAKYVDQLLDDPVLISNALRKHLTQKEHRRFMVVLDEVSEMEELAKYIKAALMPNEKQKYSRIMMTTSSERIANYWKTSWPNGKPYKLDVLAPDEAEKLFSIKAFGLKTKHSWRFELIKKKVLEDCDGLPYLIEKLGVQFSTTDKWVELYHRIQNNPLSGEDKRAFLSKYHEMPSYLKPCFLHLSIFPKCQKLSRMRIVRLWVAEGFVSETPGNKNTCEEIAEDYLNQLVERGMVRALDTDKSGRNNKIQFYSFWHGMVQSKLDALNFCQVIPQINKPWWNSHKHRRLSIHDDVETVVVPKNIRSILFFTKPTKFPDWIKAGVYRNATFLLKVLDLQGTELEQVPKEVGELQSLRYLSLRHTKVKQVKDFIGKLRNLRTLDVRQSEIRDIPKEIKQVYQLRHLLACKGRGTRAVIPVKIEPGCLSSFKYLQHLALVDSGFISELVTELKNLTQLKKLAMADIKMEHWTYICDALKQLKNLQALRLIWQDSIGLDLSCQDFPKQLKILYLEGKLKNRLPSWVSKLDHLLKLRLRDSGLKEDPLGGLAVSELKVLELEAYDGDQLDFGYNQFPELRLLRLKNLPNLKTVKLSSRPIQLVKENGDGKRRDWSTFIRSVQFEVQDDNVIFHKD